MSRTMKGAKGANYEYWSRRPFSRCGQPPGPFSKRRTHKAERQQAHAEEREAKMSPPISVHRSWNMWLWG